MKIAASFITVELENHLMLRERQKLLCALKGYEPLYCWLDGRSG